MTFNISNEINTYFEQWQEFELDEETKLSKRQLTKLVKLIETHEQAPKIFNDLELWFAGKSVREDVMSDTFTGILDEAFEEMFEDEL